MTADRRRVVQVLTNLLSNAARHSHELSPIRVSAAREGVHVALSVSDDGVGVPAEQLPHLFRKFSQLDGEERVRELGRVGAGPGHLQGDRGGPRGPHPGRERRAGPGQPVHFHPAGGGRAGQARRPAAP